MAAKHPSGCFVPPTLTETALLSSGVSKKAAPLARKKVQTRTPADAQNAVSRMILSQYYTSQVPRQLDFFTICLFAVTIWITSRDIVYGHINAICGVWTKHGITQG
jgi:hypothetical protein